MAAPRLLAKRLRDPDKLPLGADAWGNELLSLYGRHDEACASRAREGDQARHPTLEHAPAGANARA